MDILENRSWPRMPCSGIVSVPTLTPTLGDLVDISQSGCRARFIADVDYAPNVEHKVVLTPLKDIFEAEIKIIARTVWSRKGVSFDGENEVQVGFDFKTVTNADLFYRWIERVNSPGRL